MQKIEELFSGALGTYKSDTVDFEWKENPKPMCLLPHPVPKAHKETFKKAADRLVLLGVTENLNDL